MMIVISVLLLQLYIVGILHLSLVDASLPTELDPFLELLFDTNECEDFIGDSEYLSVATVACKPFKCDFPRQLCMRPSMKLTDESTNQCREIPEKCLTAANGGIPVQKSKTTKPPLLLISSTVSPVPEVLPPVITELSKTRKPEVVDDICEMEQPQGRFCGFQVMYAYNRENKRCEQFWFPGCRTEETNANLFKTEDECFKATHHCYEKAIFTTTETTTTTTETVTTSRLTRPPPRIITKPYRKPIFTVKPPKETSDGFGQSFNLQSLINGATGLNPLASLGGSALIGSGNIDSGKGTLLGLITDGISQFTNSGGVDSDGGYGGNFLENFNLDKIPQLIKTLQEVRTSGVSAIDLINPFALPAGLQQPKPSSVAYPVVSPVYNVYPPVYGSQPLPIYQQSAHLQPFRYVTA